MLFYVVAYYFIILIYLFIPDDLPTQDCYKFSNCFFTLCDQTIKNSNGIINYLTEEGLYTSKSLWANPLVNFGITVGLFDEDNIFQWKCTILGPKDTPYKGGLFFLKIIFPDDYPNKKPEILFTTPIYHLNVKFFANGKQPLGHICLSTLNNWKKEYRMNKVFPEIFFLFKNNNPDSPYDYTDNSRRNEFVNDYNLFEKKAKYFTKKYANPLGTKKEFTTDWVFTYP